MKPGEPGAQMSPSLGVWRWPLHGAARGPPLAVLQNPVLGRVKPQET